MGKKIIYILVVLSLFLLMYFFNRKQPRKFIWQASYSTKDKQPYGASVLDKMLSASWEKGYEHTFLSIRMLLDDDLLDEKNLLIITDDFYPTENEQSLLVQYIRSGGNALIVSHYFPSWFTSALDFNVDSHVFYMLSPDLTLEQKKMNLSFCSPEWKDQTYAFPSSISYGYFSLLPEKEVYVVAENEKNEPVMVRFPLGKGNLLLACNPLIFTNYGILDAENHKFIWNSLAYLQDKPLVRTEYYHAGLEDDRSPLRVIESVRAMKWAFYTGLLTLLIFMVFTAKRKQKPIPVVNPPENKMLAFVKSIAALYIRKNNNADIIRKKYLYWADKLKHRYGIDIINENHTADLYERLAAKTNRSTEEISRIFRSLDSITPDTYVADNQLIEIISKMNEII